MDPSDLQAFARAQELLSRTDDLEELPPMAPLSSQEDLALHSAAAQLDSQRGSAARSIPPTTSAPHPLLQSLLDEALRHNDVEVVRALAPRHASSSMADGSYQSHFGQVKVEEEGVPFALVGLIAQRGHVEMLERLLRLGTDAKRAAERMEHFKRGVLADVSPRTVLAKMEPPKSKEEKAKALTKKVQTCLDCLLEVALSTGDGEAVACLLPDYDGSVARGHLQPALPSALEAIAALAARRRDGTSLGALRKAGAVDWVKSCVGIGAVERMQTLSHLTSATAASPITAATAAAAAASSRRAA